MKTYKVRKKPLLLLLIFVCLIPVVLFFLDPKTFGSHPIFFFPLIGPVGLIFWIYFNLFCKISDNQLIYKNGFIQKKINIRNVREVGLSEKGWTGIFSGGLSLKYNRYDRVNIDLLNQDEFMRDLIKINPQIKVF